MSDNPRLQLIVDSTPAEAGARIYSRSMVEIKQRTTEAVGAIGTLEQQTSAYQRRVAAARQVVDGWAGATSSATTAVRGLGGHAGDAARQMTVFERAGSSVRTMLVGLGLAFGAIQAVQRAREVVELNARYDTLGVVVARLGQNIGATRSQLVEYQRGLMATGISAIASRESIARMIQANLDLSKATQLARVAQDAAVIGNVASSEAFERLVYGISSAQVEILRTLGLNVSFERSYAELAKTLGVSVDSLTEAQKAQARLGEALRAGQSIAGAYTAAMSEPGKILLSTKRYAEDLAVALGAAFKPQFTSAVHSYAQALLTAQQVAAAHPDALREIAAMLTTIAGLALAAFAGRWLDRGLDGVQSLVARYRMAQLEAAAYRENVLRIAAATEQTTAAEAAATRQKLASLQADREAILLAREEAAARLQAANARMARAVDPATLAPLGGAVVAREAAAQQKALAERSLALKNLAQLGQQQVRVEAELAAAQVRTTAATLAATTAAQAHAAAIAAQTLAARVAAGAMAMLGTALTAIAANPITALLIGIVAVNAALEWYERRVMKGTELTEAQEAAYRKSIEAAQARRRAAEDEAKRVEELTKKAKDQVAVRQEEVSKLRVLNDAHGQSEHAIKLLELRYDALIQKRRDAKEFAGIELAALNQVTDALLAQKVRAEQLAEADRQRQEAGRRGDLVVEARQAYELEQLSSAEKAKQAVLFDQLNLKRQAAIRLRGEELDAENRAIDNMTMWRLALVAATEAERQRQEVARRTDIVRSSEQEVQAARAVGTAREHLLVDMEAENRAREAAVKYARDQVALEKELAAIEEARRNKHKAIEVRQEATDAEAYRAAWENALRQVQDSIRNTFQQILTSERVSWQTFADSIVQIMSAAAAAVATAWLAQTLKIDEAMKVLRSVGSLKAAAAKLGTPGGYAAIGIGSFGLGYGIGSMTGSTAMGVGGGALGGAAMGAAIGSVLPGIGTAVGAVVGGLAGAAGGLFGASKSQREAAERLKQAAESMRTSVQAYQQFAAGNQNSFMQQWLDNLARAEQLRKQANDTMPGKKAESQRNEFLRQIDVARAEAIDRIKADFTASIEQQLNALNGPAGEYANKLKDIEQAFNDNKATAQAILGPLADLSKIEELRRRQLEQLADAEAELHRTRAEDLEIRRLVATGQDDEAARRRLEAEQRRELRKAQQEQWTEQEKAELEYIQGLERERQAKELATKAAEDAARAAEDFTQRYLRLTNRGGEADQRALNERQADERKQFADAPAFVRAQMEVVHQYEQAELAAKQAAEAQIAAIEAQTKAQMEAFDRQIEATRTGIDSARENARAISERLETTRRALEEITKFREGLRVGEMSPLSPEAQLAEARRLFQETYAKAIAGDAEAAAAFPALARDLLEKSRGYNASSGAYVNDFNQVEQLTAALEGKFGSQLTIEEQQLAEAQKQTEALEAQLAVLQAQKDAAQAAAQELIARLRSQESIAQETQNRVVAAIESQRDAVVHPAEELLTSLEQLRTSQDAAIREVGAQQFTALLENRNAAAAAAQAQIDAVRAGASLQEQAQLQQVAKLEQQRLEYNTNAIRQIQELAANGGYSVEQLREMERTRVETNEKLVSQINELQGLGGKLTAWTQPTINVTVNVSVDGSTGTGTGSGGGSIIPGAPGSGGRPLPDGFAAGGYHAGGIRLVGEEGPELEVTGPARYYSAAQTRSLLSSTSTEETVTELRAQNAKLERLVKVTVAAHQELVARLDAIIAAQSDVADELMLKRLKAGAA